MFKKLSLTLILVLLATGLIAGVVSADTASIRNTGSEANPKPRLQIGKVMAIGASDFTVEALNGEQRRIVITDETQFRVRDGEETSEAAFSDLEIGQYVGILNRKNEDGELIARLVVLLPDDFDPADIKAKRAVGEVTMSTEGGGFFKMETREGEKLTINVDENTRYTGSLSSLADLEKGTKVGILALEQEDGSLLAKAVGAQKPKPRKIGQTHGTLTAISEDSITITDRREQEHTFNLTQDTVYKDRAGEVDSLEDLETGMVVVVAHLRETDVYEAKAVLVADPALLKLKRALGQIKSINKNQLTLDANDEVLHFTIDENTRIKGLNISSLDDLDKDMRVLVLYQEDESGDFIAKAITGVKRPSKDQ